MPLVGRKLVFLGQNKRTRRSESRNVRVRTLTQHAQEGSMAARCFWRGIDAPLASEHITEKVACRDLFCLPRCVPIWNVPNFTYSPAASKQPHAWDSVSLWRCCKHSRVERYRFVLMSKLEKIHSSQLYHPLPLLLGQRGELCRAASAVMHIGHEIIRALEHPAVAPFDGVAGMDEFQPLREHRVLKAGSGALQVTARSRSPEAHCLEELKKRIDKREEQTSQAVLHTGQGAVYSSRAFCRLQASA